ncbi:hypothetical protein PR202_ga22155 [Eleusine coracana subsp. coracana]|uniref:Prefoldin subunit 2 n=1 Tax=Eleusine coracana subsp. coracana TaxID=191504 RepID=A0AAV5D1H5_ELECO|nr:hypothetical protein PR202_ga22155 [Eleusine coracana subsp. coracana]
MASQVGGDGKEAINEQVIANQYANMRSEMNQFYTKITELELEVGEHSLVIGAIEPLDPSRRCYRMIGGVLVERTIKEVLPAVKRNKEGLEEVIARMHEALERKKKEITEFELKYKIRIRKADNADEEGGKKEGTAQGVLVKLETNWAPQSCSSRLGDNIRSTSIDPGNYFTGSNFDGLVRV